MAQIRDQVIEPGVGGALRPEAREPLFGEHLVGPHEPGTDKEGCGHLVRQQMRKGNPECVFPSIVKRQGNLCPSGGIAWICE